MKSLLYYKKAEKCEENDLSIKFFTPRLTRLKLKREKLSFKAKVLRLYFSLIAGKRFRIYYFELPDGTIAHTSYVLPRCFKFPFLKKGEFVIGPCHTIETCRGQGIYPKVLKHILSDSNYDNSLMYMVVSDSNTPSIRGIEKAGFERCGAIRKTKLLKRYYKGNESNGA